MRSGGHGISGCRLALENEVAAKVVQATAVLVPECIPMFDAAEFQRPAVQCRHQVCSQDGGIATCETLVELLGFTELGQLHLISQGGQVIEDDSEFIYLEAVIDDNHVWTQTDDKRAIMTAPRYGMGLERTRKAKGKSKKAKGAAHVS